MRSKVQAAWRGRRRTRIGRRWPYDGLGSDWLAEGLSPGEPPTWVGVGAQKAGTSWWQSLLEDHPGVHVHADRPKELHFFDRFWAEPFGPDNEVAYRRAFKRPQGMAAGEWTPRYLHDPWVAPLLSRCAPDTRILILLRDPMERFLSGVAHDLARGAPSVPLLATDAFSRGLYAEAIQDYQRLFGAAHVLVLQYERCREDPAGQLSRTYEFVGLDPGHSPSGLREFVSPTTAKPLVPPAVRDALNDRYRTDAIALARVVPEIDLDLWPSVAGRQ